jgi:hypothetical protein
MKRRHSCIRLAARRNSSISISEFASSQLHCQDLGFDVCCYYQLVIPPQIHFSAIIAMKG